MNENNMQTLTFEKRVIGDCTLYCGDSLELLSAGVFGKIGAIVSDPPYGIGYQHGGNDSGRSKIKAESKTCKIIGDDVPFDPAPWLSAAPIAKMTGQPLLLMWGADNFMQRLPGGGTLLAWDKHIGRGADDSFADCEWAWSGRKTKREVFRWLWKGVLTKKTPLDCSKTNSNHFARVHVSQKPVELMRWCIEKIRPLADLPILDPYAGSGSTAIAALSLGHKFVGCEIDPAHFAMMCQRVERFYEEQGELLAA